jgi:hypothetical protein
MAPGFTAGRLLFYSPRRCDKPRASAYICVMRKIYWMPPLFALLAVSLWFAATAWTHFDTGDIDIPVYGYVAIAGGVLMSLVVGGGLMALVFYSSRHGYDDLSGGDGDKP